MKKNIIFMALMLVLILSSCSQKNNKEETTKQSTTTTEKTTKATESVTTTTTEEVTTTTEATTAELTDDGSATGDKMELSSIFEHMLKDIEDLPEVENVEITDEYFEPFLFIKPIEGATALASEGMISSIAHSAVLLRVPEGTDVEKVRKQIEQSADPQKWVCVGAEKTIVKAHNNTILLVMSFDKIADEMAQKFDELWK